MQVHFCFALFGYGYIIINIISWFMYLFTNKQHTGSMPLLQLYGKRWFYSGWKFLDFQILKNSKLALVQEMAWHQAIT